MPRSMFVCAVVLCCAAGPSAAQEAQDQFSRVWCVKAEKGSGGEYRRMVEDVGKKVQAARVGAGNLVGWTFWQAVTPGGRGAECDYFSIFTFDGFPQAMMPLGEAIEKAKIGMTESEYRQKRGSLSYIADNQLWTRVAGVGDIEEGNYVRFNKMDVHNMNEWLDLERDIWEKIMQVRVDDGTLKAWRSARLAYPRGSGLPYNAGTVDVFSDWDAIEAPARMGQVLRKAHPGKEWRDIQPRNQAARDIVHGSLWRVRAVVSAEDR